MEWRALQIGGQLLRFHLSLPLESRYRTSLLDLACKGSFLRKYCCQLLFDGQKWVIQWAILTKLDPLRHNAERKIRI